LTRDRLLEWDGCVNVRDLGGLPIEGGGETRFSVVVRADSIGGLTNTGWAALADYGVTSAIDLRGDHELDDARERPIPVTRIPITPLSGPGWEWPSMLDAYLAVLDEFRPRFTEAVDAIAAAEPAVLVHCQGGRDRTGLTVGLILAAAGVDRDVIAADHALSDDSWGPYNASWVDEATEPRERARRQRIAEPAGRTMADVLEEIDRRYGGPAGFLATSSLDTVVLRLRG
jgi:protein-tyrosine phosphatase